MIELGKERRHADPPLQRLFVRTASQIFARGHRDWSVTEYPAKGDKVMRVTAIRRKSDGTHVLSGSEDPRFEGQVEVVWERYNPFSATVIESLTAHPDGIFTYSSVMLVPGEDVFPMISAVVDGLILEVADRTSSR